MKNVEDSRLIASETWCPGTTISNNYQKNSLLPSAVKLGVKLGVPANVAADN